MRTLRSYLLLTYTTLIVLGFGSFALWVGQQFAQSTIADFVNNLQFNTILVATALVEPVEDGKVREIAPIGQLYAARTDARITVFDPLLRPLWDSTGQLPQIDLTQDSEMLSVRGISSAYAIRPNEQGESYLFAAAPILYDAEPVGYVRLALPSAVMDTAVSLRWQQVIFGFLGFVLVVAAISLWLGRKLTEPIVKLEKAALRMAAGDLSQRAPGGGFEEMQTMAHAFNQMAGQVEEIVAEQKQFAANASHELRTPLTTIRLRTEALQTGTLDPADQAQYVVEIDQEAMRLSRLVEDLTLLSRLDSATFVPGDEQVDMSRLLRLVVREMMPAADEAGVALILDTMPALPVLRANSSHVWIVVRNLLENGIKYSKAGGEVRCSAAVVDGGLELRIADKGQGIAAADLPRLTERFYRADKARTRGGTGLGLSLVASILARYNGRMQISSPGLGVGTTVLIVWPAG